MRKKGRNRRSVSSSDEDKRIRRRGANSSEDRKYYSDEEDKAAGFKRQRGDSGDGYGGRRSRNSEVIKPGLNGPLLSYKSFMDLQENPISMKDAEKYYAEYKNAHDRKQSEIFFQVHKGEHWFQEKYHPKLMYKYNQEQIKQSQALCKKFNESLENDGFKGILLENQESFEQVQDNSQPELEKKDNEENNDISSAPLFGFDANKNTLYLKLIPTHISRWELLDAVHPTPGFLGLSMSEPLKTQDFVRYAWVTYDTDENCQKSKAILEKVSMPNFDLNPVISISTTHKKVKVTPLLNKGCFDRDRKASKELIKVFDAQRLIEDNKMFDQEEKRDVKEQLDIQLLYLRRVHAFCYYCCEEYEDERMLASKCGPNHVRLMKIDNQPTPESKDLDEGEVYDENAPTLFEQNNMEKIQKIIDAGPQKMTDPMDDEELTEERTSYCRRKTKKLNVDR